MSRAATILTTALSLASAAAACERHTSDLREPGPSPSSRVTTVLPYEARGGGPTTNIDAALARIAEARCDRELRCNNVGAGRQYSSRTACVFAVRAQHHDALNRADCPAGVDQRAMEACMREVRDDDCGNSVDYFERIVACRASGLCRQVR